MNIDATCSLRPSAESSGGRAASRVPTVLVNIAVAALALAVSLAAAELALRFFYPQHLGVWYPDRDGLTLLWPRLSTYLPQFGVSANVNSFGMRDREHAAGKSEGVFRILILGDSFMEA